MRIYIMLILLIITGLIISCNDSSSGAKLSREMLKDVQLTGNLPYSVSADSSFSDTLEFISGKVGSVNLGNNKPEWIDIKTYYNNTSQIIIYGKAPADTGYYDISLEITGNQKTSTNPSFGFTFTLSVIDL